MLYFYLQIILSYTLKNIYFNIEEFMTSIFFSILIKDFTIINLNKSCQF